MWQSDANEKDFFSVEKTGSVLSCLAYRPNGNRL